jgi:hypothetical protein
MKVDSKRCYSDKLRSALLEGYQRLAREKAKYPLFWDFIDRERNNILKEYAFSAYAAVFNDDGTEVKTPTILGSIGKKHELRLRGGKYDGRLASDVVAEASQWLENYIRQIIAEGGYDPDEDVAWNAFLRPPAAAWLRSS